MYAVIKTGGKQYKVAKDDVIAVEKLDAENGASVELTEVLLVGNGKDQTTGTPLVDGATVAAEVVTQTRGKKILVFKKKRRKDYRRTRGHRQLVTMLRITDILTDGKKPAKKAAAAAPKAQAAPKAETKPAPEPKAEAKPAPKPKTEAKPAAKPADKPKAKPAAKKPADKTETKAKPAAKKPAAKKPADKKPAAKKPVAKKPAAKKPAAKKPKE
ncbi:MAG: 50S ribosomal protein L21 [Alphaproteobacteria bacterium]|nr:50S ribosomal protein L21 [Alphaproteobacteria bacterium]